MQSNPVKIIMEHFLKIFRFIGKFLLSSVIINYYLTFIAYFFRIPLKGELREKWIQIISQHQPMQNVLSIHTYINICSLHFEDRYILKNKKLTINALPTIFR